MILIFISSQQQARRHNIKISLIEQTQDEREGNIIFLYFCEFFVDNGAKNKSKCCNLKQLSILIWPFFCVMYLFESLFEFVLPMESIFPFTPSILFQCCHPISFQLLFCTYVGPAPTPYTPFHPLWMYLIDWRATRTPFLSPQARNRRRQGGALLICQFWKQKPRRIKHKRSLKIRENIFKRKFMSVLSCKFLLQIYRNVVTWNGMEYGIWGHFLKSFYLS